MVYIFLIGVLMLLWAVDGYLTVRVFKKYGPEAEENPVLKHLLRHNVKYFLLFKLVDAFAFIVAILLIVSRNEIAASILLTVFIAVYLYVNWRNYDVLKGS